MPVTPDPSIALEITKTLPLILAVTAVMVIVGACSSKISSRLNVPVLLLFLAVGMLAGPEGIGDIDFSNSAMVNVIGSVAMAFILFSGGYNTSMKSLKRVFFRGTLLATLGVVITAGTVGWLSFKLFAGQATLPWCLLLGAVISSTDAAAVFATFRGRNVGLRGDLKPLLEYESGSNDPTAAFLTMFVIDMIQAPDTVSFWSIIPLFALRMGMGLVIGWLVGKLAAILFNRIDFEYDGLYYALGVGVVLFAYGIGSMLGGNSFMAVYVCGVTMGNSKFIFQHGLGRFHDGLGWLMQVALFAMLGLLVKPSHLVGSVTLAGLLIGLLLMFVARPLAVFVCLAWSKYSWKEKIFIAWVGLRGGAPIMLATFPLVYGIRGALGMFNVVFFAVLTSVLLQGRTMMWLARAFGLDKPAKTRPRVPLEYENTGNLDGEVRDFKIVPDSPYEHKCIAELKLPHGALVLLIRRGREFVVPRGNTALQSQDILTVLGDAETLAQVAAIMGDCDADDDD